jgi:hypothetical protein
MKASMILSFLGVFTATAWAAAANMDVALEKECGELGVMKIDLANYPGADPNAVRRCADHPLGDRGASLDITERGMSDVNQADVETGLVDVGKRACYTGLLSSGCDRGYCWRKCDLTLGAGKWCWTAKNLGTGAWDTCSKDLDCLLTLSCSVGNCAACGCSC